MNDHKKFFIGVGVFSVLCIILSFAISSLSKTEIEPIPKEVTKSLTVIAADDYKKGRDTAAMVLIEYLDFECEACRAYFPVVKKLEDEFPEDLLVVKRYYPLPGHRNGLPAALAVEAAARQGKFNEMHDLLFSEQDTWGEKAVATPQVFEGYAEQIGLDMEKFRADVASEEVKARVQRDIDSGTKLGNTGTPSFYLQGEKIPNPRSFEDFKTLIEAALLKAPASETEVLGEKVHEHADFAVFLEGLGFDFTDLKYQSSDENPLDPDAHLHDGNGEIMHKHRKGITVGYFFKTLGMELTNECFITDEKKEFCNDGNKRLKFIVNGERKDSLADYEFTDLDQILISYGDEAGVADQQSSVKDEACLYSEKCPERGTPPTEGCVGGLGSEC